MGGDWCIIPGRCETMDWLGQRRPKLGSVEVLVYEGGTGSGEWASVRIHGGPETLAEKMVSAEQSLGGK